MIASLKFLWTHPLASKNRKMAIFRWLRWQLGSRLLGQPVIYDWIHGTKLVVSTGMYGATGNIYCGLHEFADMSFVLHLLRRGDGFADVGANVGSYSILASGVVGASSRAFEPHPVTFEKLRQNLVVNGLCDITTAVQSAVGKGSGSLRFTSDRDTMNQAVEGDYLGSTIDVPVLNLDSALAGFDTLLWKIDVEGFEAEVLRGAVAQLQMNSLKAIMVETVNDQICKLLMENGFEHVMYDPWSRSFVDNHIPSHNSLWVRDRTFCMERVSGAPAFVVYGMHF